MEMKVCEILRANHLLGEGLFYEDQTGKLWGVDIEGKKIWSLDLLTSSYCEYPTSEKVGWCFPTSNSELRIFGENHCVKMTNLLDAYSKELCMRIPGLNGMLRLNDAKTDSRGRIWMGSMSEESECEAKGALYCINNSGDLLVKDEGYEIANGPAINLDETMMLHTDSSQGLIYQFDFNSLAGEITNKRIWLKVDPRDGSPDGMCFDDAGFVWVAHWGAGKVVKYHGDGKEIESIAIPASQVSNVCFGGENLERLFVTTARVGLSNEQLQNEPAAGSIFEITGHHSRGIKSFPAAITFHE